MTERRTRIPGEGELTKAAKRHIQSQHATLWGEVWNAYDDSDRAAAWLAKQIQAVLAEL